MYNIIPFVLILISLVIIITIISRKFNVLANLDIQSIQAEREAKFREQIIRNRLKRTYVKYSSKARKAADPVSKFFGQFFKSMLEKLVDLKESSKMDSQSKEDVLGRENKLEKMCNEAEELIRRENFDDAEKLLIEVIKQDSRSLKAFRSLSKVYFEQKDYAEARQTLEHVLKLAEKDYGRQLGEDSQSSPEEKEIKKNELSGIYFELALISRAENEIDKSLDYIGKALVLEPNNPRHLDTKFELSIIKKDKAGATDAYERLAKVNPDNQKLPDFKKQISEL